MKVYVSIGDFSPLLRSPDYLFQGLRHAGVDGLELWIGTKSRWTAAHYAKLSKKYDLPIISVHQPLWAMTGFCFDQGFFNTAQHLGVHYVTCHPLPGRHLADVEMQEYFARLARIQERTGMQVLVENMPQQYRNGLLNRVSSLEPITGDVLEVYKAIAPHGLKLTLDTDHAHIAKPQDEPWFDEVFPAIRNIHLSSFGSDKRHQPLDTGNLDTAGLVRRLKNKRYSGLITLEVSAPKSITLWHYDFDRIRRSAALVR